MKKVLLFDVDGTLISYDGTVPVSCVEAIRKARKLGHKVYVVTGRTKNRATVGGIEVDGMICGNGAYIESEGTVLQDKKLSLEQTTEITDYLDAQGICYFMEGNDGMYGSRTFEMDAVEAYRKYGVAEPVIRKLYPMMVFPECMHQENVTKINYVLRSYQDYLTFREKFGDMKCLTWGGQGEQALFGDCALPGIDKADAIRKLIAYLGVSKENIFAFGDAEVDIPMFSCAGTSICVGSGREGAKKAADYVTDPVLEDGIVHAMEHFSII